MRRLMLTIFLLGASAISSAQDSGLRRELFADADAALAMANEAMAYVLAPESYGEATELYREAEEDLSRGQELDDIRENLNEATTLFQRAVDRTGVARVGLLSALAAREDADAAQAGNYAPELWVEAEETFADAASRLESGNLDRAKDIAADAETEYRAAELAAIENNFLSGARQLIARAEDRDVDRYSPKTLERAKRLLEEAESELRENRYDTDYPRSLARSAQIEARHSIYLAARVEAVDDDELTVEDLLLQSEEPVVRIASALDIAADTAQGLTAPSEEIIAAIADLKRDRQILATTQTQLAFLESEISSLETRLGEESERRQIQAQIQQRFEQLEEVFTDNEAQVLLSGENIIIRLALNFDSGSAVIQPTYYGLLRKIQSGIDLFPASEVEVQGHTDSFGADDFNMQLSERRAEAVRQYLLSNMELERTVIHAVGFGETRPIANNETPEGRTRNRRIDLLIRPNIDRLMTLTSQNR